MWAQRVTSREFSGQNSRNFPQKCNICIDFDLFISCSFRSLQNSHFPHWCLVKKKKKHCCRKEIWRLLKIQGGAVSILSCRDRSRIQIIQMVGIDLVEDVSVPLRCSLSLCCSIFLSLVVRIGLLESLSETIGEKLWLPKEELNWSVHAMLAAT